MNQEKEIKQYRSIVQAEKDSILLAKQLSDERSRRNTYEDKGMHGVEYIYMSIYNQPSVNLSLTLFFLLCIVELAARRKKDLEKTREKLEIKQEILSKKNSSIQKEKQFKSWQEKQIVLNAQKEKSDVTVSTKAYESQKITPNMLYMRQERRSKAGAHNQKVGFGGYDISRGGTMGMSPAVPQWTQGARQHL